MKFVNKNNCNISKTTSSIFLLILLLSNIAYAQPDSARISFKETIKGDFNSFVEDMFNVLESPLHLEKKDWIYLAAIGGAAGISFAIDREVKNIAAKNRNKVVDEAVKLGDYFGSGQSAALFPLSFYGAGLISGNEEIRTTGRLLFESLLVSGLVTQVIKIISGRARPYNNKGAFYFDPFNFKNDYNSFPSGHTVVAFTISSVLSERFNNIYLSVGLYSLASLTAYQRIYSNNHWLSDTVVSAMIGIGVGKVICSMNSEQGETDKSLKLSILPSFNSDNVGLSLNYSF